jgi:hypothetical protein
VERPIGHEDPSERRRRFRSGVDDRRLAPRRTLGGSVSRTIGAAALGLLAVCAPLRAFAQVFGNYPVIIVPPPAQNLVMPKPAPNPAPDKPKPAEAAPTPSETVQRYHGRTQDLGRF